MNNNFKKIISLFIVTLFVLLSGCGDNTQNNTQSDAQKNTAAKLNPEDADGKFSLAIFPDTQQEVISYAAKNGNFLKRCEWLAENAKSFDVRFLVHTGDVVNWGDADESQLVLASDGMAVIDEANIPVIYSLGNHDTAAVGVGGSAADPPNTSLRVRDTSAFNKYFSCERYPYLNVKDEGIIDNSYALFEAAGLKWMIISLELWPREEVIEWANEVVAEYPHHNVIVSTHSYMEGDGSIMQSNGGYGANSPQYLYDNFIHLHENIKLVFCGHVGNSTVRTDYGEKDNKIYGVLGCFHSNEQTPLRILEIDVNEGSIKGSLYSPADCEDELTPYSFYFGGLEFVK